MTRYYNSRAIGTGCKEFAYVRVVDANGPEIDIYNGKVQQYLSEFDGWQDFSDCYVKEANGLTLEPNTRYKALRYENYSDGTPFFVAMSCCGVCDCDGCQCADTATELTLTVSGVTNGDGINWSPCTECVDLNGTYTLTFHEDTCTWKSNPFTFCSAQYSGRDVIWKLSVFDDEFYGKNWKLVLTDINTEGYTPVTVWSVDFDCCTGTFFSESTFFNGLCTITNATISIATNSPDCAAKCCSHPPDSLYLLYCCPNEETNQNLAPIILNYIGNCTWWNNLSGWLLTRESAGNWTITKQIVDAPPPYDADNFACPDSFFSLPRTMVEDQCNPMQLHYNYGDTYNFYKLEIYQDARERNTRFCKCQACPGTPRPDSLCVRFCHPGNLNPVSDIILYPITDHSLEGGITCAYTDDVDGYNSGFTDYCYLLSGGVNGWTFGVINSIANMDLLSCVPFTLRHCVTQDDAPYFNVGEVYISEECTHQCPSSIFPCCCWEYDDCNYWPDTLYATLNGSGNVITLTKETTTQPDCYFCSWVGSGTITDVDCGYACIDIDGPEGPEEPVCNDIVCPGYTLNLRLSVGSDPSAVTSESFPIIGSACFVLSGSTDPLATSDDPCPGNCPTIETSCCANKLFKYYGAWTYDSVNDWWYVNSPYTDPFDAFGPCNGKYLIAAFKCIDGEITFVPPSAPATSTHPIIISSSSDPADAICIWQIDGVHTTYPCCYELGASGTFVAPFSGAVTFYCNDNTFSDNSGSYTLTFNGIPYTINGFDTDPPAGTPGPVLVSGNSYTYSATGNIVFGAAPGEDSGPEGRPDRGDPGLPQGCEATFMAIVLRYDSCPPEEVDPVVTVNCTSGGGENFLSFNVTNGLPIGAGACDCNLASGPLYINNPIVFGQIPPTILDCHPLELNFSGVTDCVSGFDGYLNITITE